MGRIKKEALPQDSLKRKILELEDMTLKKFAEIADVSPPYLSYYLNGNRKLRKEIKNKIKRALIKFNFIPKPPPKHYCTCPHCGSRHRSTPPFKLRKVV